MKKKPLYLMLALASLLVISCTKDTVIEEEGENLYETIAIPDEEFEKALIELGIDTDGLVNHKMTKSKAEAVEELSIYNKSIYSLVGIEAFINLKELNIHNTILATIDLSKNLKLESVGLAENNLSSIKGLENALNLEEISLSNNVLKELTLNSSSLKKIFLKNNLLNTVTLNIPGLRILSLTDNNLSSFDASTLVNLKELDLVRNKLEAIDVSNNLILKFLSISENSIANLTLGKNDSLVYISSFSNNLSSLDLSNLISLDHFYLRGNPNLTCIKAGVNQVFTTQSLSSYQELKVDCN